MACRRSTIEIMDYIMKNGGEFRLVDDYGRNPLHDACWRSIPDFEIIMTILDRDPDLLRMEDVRGATPLHYIPQEQWMLWCAFLYHQRDRYWPIPSIHNINMM
jgi:ankyrin repeat protein